MPVIYRHRVQIEKSHYTIYVGQGASLAGPSRNHLVHQYRRTPGTTRQRIRDHAELLPATAFFYTEILKCADYDLSDAHKRRALEELFVHVSKLKSQQEPVFITQRLEFLNR